MSKTNPLPKTLPPPTLGKSPLNNPLLVWRQTRADGMRECQFTTIRFALESRASAWDTLKIEIDEHNGAPSSQILIRGEIEASEMPNQLRWLADAIAQHRDNNSAAIRDHVTFEKSYGGGA